MLVSSIWAQFKPYLRGIEGDRTIAHAWPEVTSPEVTWLFSRSFFSPYFFSVLFFFVIFNFFPVFFLIFFPYFFSRIFFSPYYFSVLFQKSQRFKISVSYFSSTCRYNTVHVPCGIAIQTSSVGLPLDGWGARMRDLKGPTMN